MSKLPLKASKLKLGKNSIVDAAVIDLDKAGPHKVVEVARVASAIIDAEVELINDFGAKRLLFEHPCIPLCRRAAWRLRKTRDLKKFQESMKLLDAKISKDQPMRNTKIFEQLTGIKLDFSRAFFDHPQYKWLSFFVARAGVYDINFFDDYEAALNERSYFHFLDFLDKDPDIGSIFPAAKHLCGELMSANNSRREAKMIKNIRRNLVDKTVVICGEFHMNSIFAGLKKVAHLEPPAHFEL